MRGEPLTKIYEASVASRVLGKGDKTLQVSQDTGSSQLVCYQCHGDRMCHILCGSRFCLVF